MGTLFGFAVGYVVGARMGGRGFDEVVQAARDLRDSAEFRGLVDAVRSHAVHTARSGAAWVASEESEPVSDLLARARAR